MAQRLKDGVRTFRKSEFPPRRALFESLAAGQSPHTLFITCSDSRIDPSLITQTAPGELFVIRNAGNLVPAQGSEPVGGEAATLEYAVVALGVEQIIVCGHSRCGAMAGLMDPASLAPLPGVSSWLRHAESTRERAAAAGEGADAVRLNVLAQLDQLRTYPFVREREAAGDLTLRGWIYVFEDGDVLELQEGETFASLLEHSQVGGTS